MRGPAYLTTLLGRMPARPERGALYLHLGHVDEHPTGDIRAAQAELDRRVLHAAQLADGQSVLDVGCGIGGTIAAIDERHRDMTLTGVNIGLDQLEVAARSVVPRPENDVRWVHADALALPFEADSFDRVLCVEAMFHFSSRAGFFREAARVLRPGGVLSVTDIHLRAGADEALARWVTEGLAPWPDPFVEEGSLAELADAAGFEFRVDDATPAIGASLRSIIGDEAIHDPRGVADAGDRGTAALGALHAAGALAMVYGVGQLKAR